ncbi:MAG: S-layer homology domain-containing protein, partial [Clostridia bacterium]
NGDYSEHWANRDYTLDAENIKCSALIVHGLNDYNVRTKEMELMYNAFDKAGIESKILLHQDGHLTPTYPSGKLVFSIGDQSYDEILNKWFSHYLYDVDNGAEDMAAVTAQDSHDTDKWNTYDSWKTDDIYSMTVDADSDSTTTITSDYSSNGITRSNWQSKLTAGTTNCSVMYKETVDCDTTIKGTVAVNFSAATSNAQEYTLQTSANTESVVTPNGADHDALMETLGTEGITTSDSTTSAEKDYPIIERDGLMVSAMLVDIAPEGETFPAFNTRGSYVPKETIAEGGAWMGGGLENFDLVKLTTSDVSYKIISRGWMDLCNPTAGFDSATADSSSKVQLGDGKYYDYTIYLQSTVYTIEEGHTLALVIYPYEQGMARVTQNYDITVKDASVSADIPVNALPFEDVEGHWALNYITRAYNDGIMNGTGATTFEPESTFTRAMLATTLYRLEGEPKVTAENPFTDVKDGEWYTDAVIWAAENGIVKGITEDTFAPNDIATREQFATMMYRYAQYKQVDVTVSEDFVLSFNDADKVSEYAVDAMKWAVENELINGRTETDLVPQGLTKRAEAATILVRFDENIIK